MITLVILAGIFFRFWRLNEIPPGIHYDEAYNGLDAIKTMESGDFKIFYPENNGREGLWMAMIATSFKFFGVSEFTFRMVSAIVGSLTLIGFFFLIRQLRLTKLSVFIGLSSLCFSFWHLNFSRIMYRGILVPCLLVWIFYFFYKGLDDKKYGWAWMIGAGTLTGLGLHTYISFRVMPLILIIITVAYLILQKKSFFKKQWKNALILIFSAFIVASPILYYFITHQDDFIGRSSSVSVFNNQEMSAPQALGKSLVYHLGAFFVYGDPNQRHNHHALPLIPASWSILLAIGFALSLKEIFQTFKRKKKTDLFDASLLAQSIFWVMLIPGVMSIEGIPHALRIIGVIPAIFIFIAIPFDYFLRLYRKIGFSQTLKQKTWRYSITGISIIAISLVVLINGIVQVVSYFYEWAEDEKTIQSFDRKAYEYGKLIQGINPKENNFLIIPDYHYITADGKESGLKPAELAGYPNIKNFTFRHPAQSFKEDPCENALYLFFETDEETVKNFGEKCPNLQAEKIKLENGQNEFWLMK
jgi:4-amino-4-deoxy-L-arabinose transferase-like glycosyltransferase